jgi:hypothetical protein
MAARLYTGAYHAGLVNRIEGPIQFSHALWLILLLAVPCIRAEERDSARMLEDLDRQYRQDTNAAKAATGFLKAFELLDFGTNDYFSTDLPWVGRGKVPLTSEPLSTQSTVAATVTLRRNRAALDALLQVTNSDHCRYPINLRDGVFTSLPHIRPLLDADRLLCLNATVDADADRENQAVRSLLAIFSLAKSLDEEPFFVSQRIKGRVIAMALKTFEQVASRCRLSASSLKRLELTVAECGKRVSAGASFKSALSGESAIWLSFSDAPAERQIEALQCLPEGLRTSELTNVLKNDYPRSEDQKYLTAFREDVLAALACSNPPCWKAPYDICERRDGHVPEHLIASTLYVRGVTGALEKEHDSLRTLRILQISIALQRYWQEHRSYPQSLLTLMPEYLNTAPTEPMDTRLLKYRLTGHGYEISSAVPKKGWQGSAKVISLTVAQKLW